MRLGPPFSLGILPEQFVSKDVGICPQDGCNQPSKHLLKVKGKFGGDVQGANILAPPPPPSFYDVGRVEVVILALFFLGCFLLVFFFFHSRNTTIGGCFCWSSP